MKSFKSTLTTLGLLSFACLCQAQTALSSADKSLFSAAERGDAKGIQASLLAGANPNAVDASGKFALERVSLGGRIYDFAQTDDEIDQRLKGVELLVKKGAKVDIKRDEYFPYHIVGSALNEGRYDLAQLLVDKGANKTALSIWNIAKAPRYPSGKPDPIRRKIFEKALENTPKKQKSNPLVSAIASDDSFFFTQRMLAAGFSPNDRSILGETPLLVAIDGGKVDIVSLLIKYKVDVNQKYVNPKNGFVKPETRWENKTPLELAREMKQDKIVQLLEAAGAKTSESR